MEEERKFEVDPAFELPDLHGALPSGGSARPRAPVTLTATYFDTADLRLARAGASLRHRAGDDEPWTVKLATDIPQVRQEVSRPGDLGDPPGELVRLVTVLTRGAPLAPVAVLRTRRLRVDLVDGSGAVLAELADDSVEVLDGDAVVAGFREVEVERREGGRALLSRVEEVLLAAGARQGVFTSKLVRALGPQAERPADLVAPGDRLPDRASAGEVVTQALRRGAARVLAHDPLVRLGEPLPGGDTAVHQMRVGVRRLRSDLRTFGPLLDPARTEPLRAELKWLAELLGGVRDAEVLRARLPRTASADPLADPLPEGDLARLDALLAARYGAASAALADQMSGDRYIALVELLIATAADPALTGQEGKRARKVLPALVTGQWKKLSKGSKKDKSLGIPTVRELAADALSERWSDSDWHRARIHAKRARYAAETASAVLGAPAEKLAAALEGVQDMLGEHQDAAQAARCWLEPAAGDPSLGVTCGRLHERERALIRRLRADFPALWRSCARTRERHRR